MLNVVGYIRTISILDVNKMLTLHLAEPHRLHSCNDFLISSFQFPIRKDWFLIPSYVLFFILCSLGY